MSRSVYRVNPEWERLHRDFHRSLIAGCGSRWLLSFCLQLADQSFRYRQIAFKKAFRGRPDTDGHRAVDEYCRLMEQRSTGRRVNGLTG